MNATYNSITIVGCGNIGAYLANAIALKSVEENFVKKLILVDNDIIEHKNFPYVYQNLNKNKKNDINKYIGNPKVNLLKLLLKNLNHNLNIEINYIDYRYLSSITSHKGLIIDCRDTEDEDSLFNLKISCEGIFGKIIINPADTKCSATSPYILGLSKFYSSYFSHIIVNNYIIPLENYGKERSVHILNLFSGKKYEYKSKNRNSSMENT